jgi:putative flippase GtrA
MDDQLTKLTGNGHGGDGRRLSCPVARRIWARRPVRQLAVGAICSGFQLGLFLILRRATVPFAANTIAFFISTQVNFVLSASITWRDRHVQLPKRRTHALRYTTYNLGALIGMAINAGSFAALRTGTNDLVALAGAQAIALLATYNINDHVTFRARPAIDLTTPSQVEAAAR